MGQTLVAVDLAFPPPFFFRVLGGWRLIGDDTARDTPGSTRMEIRTWRSAIADLAGSPTGEPPGALGEGTPGWVWRCDAAISRYHKKKHAFLCVFHVQPPKHKNGAIFVNTEGFRPFLSKPSFGAPQWALMARLLQKERLKSPHTSLF